MWGDPATAALFTWPALGMLWLGAFIGAIASGGAGFAFALSASAIWLHVLDPIRATLLVVACSALLQFFTIWPLRHHIDGRWLTPFLIGGVLGIPIGVHLRANTDVNLLKSVLGGFLVLFGSYALLAPRLPVIVAGGRAADGAVGLAGGILGGL